MLNKKFRALTLKGSIWFLSIYFITTGSTLAYEVDQFTNRDKVPADSTADINMIIKERIEKAVSNSNNQFFGLKQVDCQKDNKEARRVLFENLKSYLVSNSDVGLVEKQVMKDENIDKRIIAVDQSIYNEAQQKNVILKGILKTFGIAPVIQVNEVQIGTDKLGHFLNEGYTLYLQNFSQSDEVKRKYNTALFNKSTENDYFGLKTTGIKSYADLAANYEGYQFWNRMCGKIYETSTQEEKDYFQKNKCTKNAYIRCSIDLETGKGQWTINELNKFNIEDYITPAWDESINCSGFREDMQSDIKSALSRRAYTYKGDPKKPCPAEPSKCKQITNKYSHSAMAHVISPECKSIVKSDKDSSKTSEKEKEAKASFSKNLESNSSKSIPKKSKTAR